MNLYNLAHLLLLNEIEKTSDYWYGWDFQKFPGMGIKPKFPESLNSREWERSGITKK